MRWRRISTNFLWTQVNYVEPDLARAMSSPRSSWMRATMTKNTTIVVVDRRRRRQLGHRHHLREHHLRQSLDPKDIFLEDTKTFWTQNQRKILRYKNVLEENYFGNFNDVTKISTSRSIWKRSGHIFIANLGRSCMTVRKSMALSMEYWSRW